MLELTEKEKRAHEAAKRNGAAYCKSEKDIIIDVIFAAESKYYRKLGHMTVVDFIEHEMKIDSQLMYDLNIVVKRALIYPYLKKALQERKLSCGKALRIGASLTKENVKEFVDFACKNTIREINKKVAENKDPGKKRESAKQVGDVMKVQIWPTLEEWKLFERARVIQTNANRSRGIKDTVVAAIEAYLHKNDPVEKAKRTRPAKEPSAPFVRTKKRIKLTAAEKAAVDRRDEGKCTWDYEDGHRCNNEQWVHKHHIVPPNQGGTNHPDNLQTLCAYHHDLVHQLEFGFMKHAHHAHH